MPRIFISYRRLDASHAGRLADRIKSAFGKHNVFLDVRDVYVGVDFREHIAKTVSKCDAMLVVIGPNWFATDKSKQFRTRLENPDDLLRFEVLTALARKLLVVPVLVAGASMPSAHQLPPELRPLASRQAIIIEHGADFDDQIERLIGQLQAQLNKSQLRCRIAFASLVLLCALITGLWFRPPWIQWNVLPDNANYVAPDRGTEADSHQPQTVEPARTKGEQRTSADISEIARSVNFPRPAPRVAPSTLASSYLDGAERNIARMQYKAAQLEIDSALNNMDANKSDSQARPEKSRALMLQVDLFIELGKPNDAYELFKTLEPPKIDTPQQKEWENKHKMIVEFCNHTDKDIALDQIKSPIVLGFLIRWGIQLKKASVEQTLNHLKRFEVLGKEQHLAYLIGAECAVSCINDFDAETRKMASDRLAQMAVHLIQSGELSPSDVRQSVRLCMLDGKHLRVICPEACAATQETLPVAAAP